MGTLKKVINGNRCLTLVCTDECNDKLKKYGECGTKSETLLNQ